MMLDMVQSFWFQFLKFLSQFFRRLSRVTEGVTESGTLLYTKSKFAPTQPSHNRIRKFFEFGGETVPFSEEDKLAIKKQCNANPNFPSLILLGFKPAASIPFYHLLKNPYLVYPNDEACRGSADAFAHLHASMLRKKVVGVGELLYRVGAISFLVALFPVEEELEDAGSDEENEDYDDDDDDDDETVEERSVILFNTWADQGPRGLTRDYMSGSLPDGIEVEDEEDLSTSLTWQEQQRAEWEGDYGVNCESLWCNPMSQWEPVDFLVVEEASSTSENAATIPVTVSLMGKKQRRLHPKTYIPLQAPLQLQAGLEHDKQPMVFKLSL